MRVMLFSDLLRASAESIRDSGWDNRHYDDGWKDLVLSEKPPFQVQQTYNERYECYEVSAVEKIDITRRIADLQDEINDLRASLALADNQPVPLNADDLRVVRNHHLDIKNKEARKKALAKLSEEDRVALGLEDEKVEI